MSDNYVNGKVFGPDYPDGKDYPYGKPQEEFDPDNAFTTAFKDSIPDLIRDGIIASYANTDLESEESTFVYGSGGPSALSKL